MMLFFILHQVSFRCRADPALGTLGNVLLAQSLVYGIFLDPLHALR